MAQGSLTYSNGMAKSPLVQHFTTSEGLPSNGVYKIFQDSKKFIWFATDAGVSKYDGTKFNYYRKQDGLSSNDVFDIKEDSNGRIWFFHTNASLNFFKNNYLHNENNTAFLDSLKSDDFFRQIYEDEKHNLYFYFNSQRLIYSLDSINHVTKFKLPSIHAKNHFKPTTVEAMSVRYMTRDANGEFNFWTPGGFFASKQHSKKIELVSNAYRYREVITSSTNKKYILVRDNDSINFNVKRFNGEVNFGNIESLAGTGSNYITSILEDKNGLLWISTYDKGVYCFKDKKVIFHFEIKDAKSIIQDHENNIWISSMKEGVYKISPFFYNHEHFENSGFQNSGVFALCQYDSTGIWCSNGKMLYLLKNKELYKFDFQQTEKSFNQILQVNRNLLFVSETGKLPYALEGIQINHAEKKILVKKVSQSPLVMNKIIYNQKKGEISSFNQVFLYLIPMDQLFKKLTAKRIGERISNIYYNTNNELSINAKRNYLYQNKNEIPYKELTYFNTKKITEHLNLDNLTELFNIEGDSLFLFQNKKFYNLSASFEQPIDLLIKHLVYQDSTLFIATSKNIYICEHPLNKLQNKPVLLNLIDINFKSIHGILFNQDKLYVASDDGLTSLPYSALHNSSVFSPIPYFQSITVNDEENMDKKDPVSLISNERINISFGCINYSVSPNIFSYKLEGTDADWTEVKGNNVVLQNLSRGTYLFKLRARKPASAWSEPIEFGITVNSPIWQHPLFFVFIFLIVASIAFLLILRQKNIELARRQMEHQILLLEQKSHQAMMNPHFIFNSLGSIQNYLLHNRPNEAGVYLSQFARLIRQNLNSINSSMINLEEEIDRLKNYLDLEKIRMGDKFEYHIGIDEAVESEDISIPSMIIQPFIENSIWHGIANLDEKGFVTVFFNLWDDKSLQIIVEDTGVGIKNAENFKTRNKSHLKLGMDITRKRLQLLSQKYGVKTGIEYSELTPGAINPGTKVVIFVPFLYGNSKDIS
jgi:ligand-binding sensor domain-containing protein